MLQSLPVEQTGQLLANLLGNADLPGNLKEVIVEKAQGNPFFVEELIRSLLETEQLTRQNDQWQLAANNAQISLPNTLRGVLSARIDRLPDTARSVLQSASVIGRTFDLRLLEQIARLNGELSSNIVLLQSSGLVEPESDHFVFRHVLIQEAAYDSILLKLRREMHLKIGESLEKSYADRLDEFAPLIARHFYSAGDPRSLKYDLLAGEKAVSLYANAEAVHFFSRIAKAGDSVVDQV
jgi:predicted ATPase